MQGRIAMLAVICAGLGWAQDWGMVRGLKAGSMLEVRREDKQVFRGALARVTENQLELSGEAGRMRFGRSTVRLVRVREGADGWRGRWFGWLSPGWKTVYEARR